MARKPYGNLTDPCYGLSDDQCTELLRRDAEHKRRIADAKQPSVSGYGDSSISSNAVGCALAAALMIGLLIAFGFGVSTALDWSSVHSAQPALTTAERERALDALDTRIAELEDRTQRRADAAAGSSPVPAPPTSTPYPHYAGDARAVSPPEYLGPYIKPIGTPTAERGSPYNVGGHAR